MEEIIMTHKQPTLTHEDLYRFTGDILRFEHSLNHQVVFTPGVLHVATFGQAFWLIDAIASYLTPVELKPHVEADQRIGEMHFWQLTVKEDRTALLEARADSGCQPFIKQEIESTNFPLDSVDIWAAADGSRWTLYLPTEH